MAPTSQYSTVEIMEIGKRAWKTASRAAKHMSKHSKIVNPSMEKCIPRFEREEVVLGDVLGSGGFNDVYEVKRIALVEDLVHAKHAKKISSPLQIEHRAFVAKHVFRESSQNCRYAVKFLSVETIEDPNRFCTGAADLVVVRNTILLFHIICCWLIVWRGGGTHCKTKYLGFDTLSHTIVVHIPSTHCTKYNITGSQIFSVIVASKHYQATWYGRCWYIRLCEYERTWLFSLTRSIAMYFRAQD